MKIPKKLKIGALWWRVEEVDVSEISDEEIAGGCQSERTQVIKIDKDLSQGMKEAVFIHEILHCIDYQLDHDFVEMLANQLHQVLSENKLI